MARNLIKADGVDAIFFDLDGTLWDSAAGVSLAWQRAVERSGYQRSPITEEEFRNCMGMRIDDIGKKLFPDLPEAQRNALVRECLKEEHELLRQVGGQVFPGVEPTLCRLQERFPLCVVSNCELGYIENFFAITGLGRYFADHISFGATNKHKGHNTRLLMDRHGFRSPIFVGDTVLDREAARLNDIPFVYAAYGFGDLDEYDYRIETFSELMGLLVI